MQKGEVPSPLNIPVVLLERLAVRTGILRFFDQKVVGILKNRQRLAPLQMLPWLFH